MANLVVPDLPIPSQGMNLEVTQHAMPDNMLLYAQDILFDRPGQMRVRGPLQTIPTNPPAAFVGQNQLIGITSIRYRDGTIRVAVFYTNPPGSNTFNVRYIDGQSGNTLADIALSTIWGGGDGIGSTQTFDFDAKPAFGGGRLIHFSQADEPSTSFYKGTAYYWLGAAKATYNAGTASVVANSTTVTGTGTTWLPNVEPGMFLYMGNTFIGVVKSVTSNVALELDNAALSPTAGPVSYTLYSMRPPRPADDAWVTEGEATCTTSSTVVTGGNTKWRDQGVTGPGTHFMFRASDMNYVGTVSSVTNNISLTLAANAAVALNGEDYVIIRQSGGSGVSHTNNSFPKHHAFWKGYQFYANWNSGRQTTFNAPTGRRNLAADSATVFIRGPQFLDEGDTSPSGSFIVMQPSAAGGGASLPIKGLGATANALLVFFQNETQVIVGNSPDDFQTRPLLDDGLLSAQSMANYKQGIVWAGKRGVYYYDGAQVHDLTEGRIKTYYTEIMGRMVFTATQAYAMIVQDHLILSLVNISLTGSNSSSFQLFRWPSWYGQTGGPPAICFNLKTGAVSFFTNFGVYGVASARDTTSQGGTNWFLVAQGGQPANPPQFADADAIFSRSEPRTTNVDAWNTSNIVNYNGPNIYIESKLYDLGDPERKKIFKQIQMWMNSPNPANSLFLEVFGTAFRGAPLDPGGDQGVSKLTLNTNGTQNYQNFRQKFLVRSTHFGYRIYQVAAQSPNSVNDKGTIIDAIAVGYKPMRPGRV